MFIILVALLVVFLGTSIWAIIDPALRPPEAFVAFGDSKALWITLIAVFTLARWIHLGARLPVFNTTKGQQLVGRYVD